MPASDALPPAPRERKLPFKRTVKRKSVETPTNKSTADPDGVEFFRRSDLFDKFQQQESATKAQRRKQEKTANEDAADDSEIQAQLLRDSHSASGKAHRDSVDHDLKRQRISLALSDDEEEANSRPSTQRSPRKLSGAPLGSSPSKLRGPTQKTTSAAPARAPSSSSPKTRATVITLDSSDDDDDKPSQSRGKAREVLRSRAAVEESSVARPEPPRAETPDSDTDLDPVEPESSQVDELAAKFMAEARERMRKRHAENGANPASTTPATPPEVVEIFVQSHLEGTMDMRLSVVKQSWVLYNQKKKMPVLEPTLNSMFFTWRGNKVYDFTTLASLDIKRNNDNQLYSIHGATRDGFDGWEKVHMEAWTSELFEEHQREKDKERLRRLGELEEDEPGQAPTSEKVASIKVILKSKDNGTQNLTVPKNVEVAKLSLAFRTVKKIPAEREIVLHFDGEALDEESTIDDVGIEDMDCIEVHVK
ncbi:protein ESC2 [Apiospora sp. TS-2023a]